MVKSVRDGFFMQKEPDKVEIANLLPFCHPFCKYRNPESRFITSEFPDRIYEYGCQNKAICLEAIRQFKIFDAIKVNNNSDEQENQKEES